MSAPDTQPASAANTDDLRTERDRTPGAYRPPDLGKGEFRNVYRRGDGTLRMGPGWRDRAAAGLAREVLPGETFVECRDTRFEQISGADMGLRS